MEWKSRHTHTQKKESRNKAHSRLSKSMQNLEKQDNFLLLCTRPCSRTSLYPSQMLLKSNEISQASFRKYGEFSFSVGNGKLTVGARSEWKKKKSIILTTQKSAMNRVAFTTQTYGFVRERAWWLRLGVCVCVFFNETMNKQVAKVRATIHIKKKTNLYIRGAYSFPAFRAFG